MASEWGGISAPVLLIPASVLDECDLSRDGAVQFYVTHPLYRSLHEHCQQFDQGHLHYN